MKKYLLSSVFALTAFMSYSQHIQNIYIVPATPTTNDIITFYADVSFTSGACADKTQNQGNMGNNLYGYALHCIGPLTYICNHTDTFVFNPLTAGNYKFIFTVDNGMWQTPCTPGIVAGPTDTLEFTVVLPTLVTEINNSLPEIYPIPAANYINCDFKISGKVSGYLSIKNILGEELTLLEIDNSIERIDIINFQDGIYILSGKVNDTKFLKKFVVSQ